MGKERTRGCGAFVQKNLDLNLRNVDSSGRIEKQKSSRIFLPAFVDRMERFPTPFPLHPTQPHLFSSLLTAALPSLQFLPPCSSSHCNPDPISIPQPMPRLLPHPDPAHKP